MCIRDSPGTIGLGPIRAIQYGLTPICYILKKHNPEVAYCDSRNTIFIKQSNDLKWAIEMANQRSDNWEKRYTIIQTLDWLGNLKSATRIINFIMDLNI